MKELRLQTPVDVGRSHIPISLHDRTLVIGSCFADNIGARMKDLGFDVCVNPFGTLYNPVSVCNSIARLSSGVHYQEEDCVEMGAGAGLFCSFDHHTSFARKTREEFVANANAVLDEAAAFWKETKTVIITLGTAWFYEYVKTGQTVSNCLKIDQKQFEHKFLPLEKTEMILMNMVSHFADRNFIFTVSPIRYLKDGAHGNQLSKSTLLLAEDAVVRKFRNTVYFPAYEILMDELRDYRFYAEDMAHPSEQATEYVWKRFLDFALEPSDLPELERREDELRRSRHHPILHQD